MSYRYTTQDIKNVMARNEPKKNKFGAKKVMIDNIVFDSKREGARYNELKLMQGGGIISAIEVHPSFSIDYCKDFTAEPIHICNVVLDFQYLGETNGGKFVYEDTKGKDTDLSRLKRKLVEAFYGIKVTLVK